MIEGSKAPEARRTPNAEIWLTNPVPNSRYFRGGRFGFRDQALVLPAGSVHRVSPWAWGREHSDVDAGREVPSPSAGRASCGRHRASCMGVPRENHNSKFDESRTHSQNKFVCSDLPTVTQRRLFLSLIHRHVCYHALQRSLEARQLDRCARPRRCLEGPEYVDLHIARFMTRFYTSYGALCRAAVAFRPLDVF